MSEADRTIDDRLAEARRKPRFAEAMFAYWEAKSNFEDALADAGFSAFEKIGGDDYDNSIEFIRVANDARLTEHQQRIVRDAGFNKAYVNHLNGWETHYSWTEPEFKADRGWRRRYVSDPEAKTTNVIGGPPNPGYYEISFWPEDWAGHEQWLETGYMRIVPDPLDPLTRDSGLVIKDES